MPKLYRRARALLKGLAGRSFDAAAGGRRWQDVPYAGPINADVAMAAATIRARARAQARNNPHVVSGVSGLVTGLIGAGIRPVSLHPDPARRRLVDAAFDAWAGMADVEGRTDFYGLQAHAVQAMAVDGEAFLLTSYGPDGLRLQLIDADQVPDEGIRPLPDSAYVWSGVELDVTGRRLAYHILATSPDFPYPAPIRTIRIPADRLCHLFRALAPGQVRGVSWLAPVLLPLANLDRYADAQLQKQLVAALHVGFVIDPQGSAGPYDGSAAAGVLATGMEPGALKVLAPGQDVRFSDPPDAGEAVPFIAAQLRAVAAGLGVPEHILTGDVSRANYSSLRAALVDFRARLEQLQFAIIVPQLCRPVWRAWVLGEVLAGRLPGTVDEYLPVKWLPPKAEWVDPLKDVQAEVAAIAAGLKSRRQSVAELGYDIEQLDNEIAADRARETALALQFDTGAPSNATPAN